MNIYITILKSESIQNKYLNWYCKIINSALSRASSEKEAKKILGYCEGHHIVPKSFNLGGKTDPNNIVYLTAKEHIFVHRLLCKFAQGPHRYSALQAFHCMCFKDNGGKNKRKPSLLQLSKAREAMSIVSSLPKGIRGVPEWSNCNTIDIFKKEIETYVGNNMSDPEIGKLYGVSAQAIFIWRKKLGISNRRLFLRDPQWLYEQYIVNKLSAGEISKKLGCTGVAVTQYLHKFNIPVRSHVDSQRNRHKKGKDIHQLSYDAPQEGSS